MGYPHAFGPPECVRVTHVRRSKRLVARVVTAIVAFAAMSGCSATSTDASARDPVPTRQAPSTTQPTLTDANGAPIVEQFHAPPTYYCLSTADTPRQAQINVGWSVPSATELDITLDGEPVPSGIRDTLPFHVPAGPPSGVGTTIVFACGQETPHTIEITWRTSSSTSTIRTLLITKAATP
jgi:hypothetical protein